MFGLGQGRALGVGREPLGIASKMVPSDMHYCNM